MLGRVGVGAGHEHAPLGVVGQRGPDLLAGHPPLAVVLDRLGLEAGQVRAAVGLGEALAPDLLAGEDRRDVALLLRVGAVGDHGGPAHREPEHVGRAAARRRAPSRRRRSPAPSGSHRGRRTPRARTRRPSRPRSACAATRAELERGLVPAAALPGWLPRATRAARRGRPARRGESERSTARAGYPAPSITCLSVAHWLAELALEHALEERLGQAHRARSPARGRGSASACPLPRARSRCRRSTGRLPSTTFSPKARAGSCSVTSTTDSSSLPPGPAVDLAQARADAHRPLVLPHRRHRVGLPAVEPVRVGHVVEYLLRAALDPGLDREVDHGLSSSSAGRASAPPRS